MTVIGIGVIGCGGAARDLCNAIDEIDRVELAVVFDTEPGRARELAAPRGALVAGSLDELLAYDSVQVAYVALPHSELSGIAARALMAGKHALVEKPMGIAMNELDRIEALSTERSLRLGAMFVLRQAGAVRLAREYIMAGAIGKIRQVRISTILDKPESYWQTGPTGTVSSSWRSMKSEAGGGVLLMNSLHQIDAMRFITGLDFVRVTAELTSATPGVEVEDGAVAVFRLSNGATASVTAAAHSPGAETQERIEFDGTLGRIDVPASTGRDVIRMYLRKPWRNHPAGRWVDVRGERRGLYLETLRAFITAIRNEEMPPVGVRDAKSALATVLACYRSAEQSGSVSV